MDKEFDGMMKKLMARSKKEWDLKEKKRAEEEAKKRQLTDQQVENWRRVLVGMIGPCALIAPREEIQKLRDKMQNDVYELDKELKEKGE